mmetsp:Transcript_32741/g.83054  ORF Transcript_32741/g.83054 Transcript_32741/m.83054 type:complete len:464 (-) Transcript_32741:181-1572(-)
MVHAGACKGLGAVQHCTCIVHARYSITMLLLAATLFATADSHPLDRQGTLDDSQGPGPDVAASELQTAAASASVACSWHSTAWDQCCVPASATCRMFVLCAWRHTCPGSLLAALAPNLLLAVAAVVAAATAAAWLMRVYTRGAPLLPIFSSSYSLLPPVSTPPVPDAAADIAATQTACQDLGQPPSAGASTCAAPQRWHPCWPDLALCCLFWSCYTICAVHWGYDGSIYPGWLVAAAGITLVGAYFYVRPIWSLFCWCPCVADDGCAPGKVAVRAAHTPGARMGAALSKAVCVAPEQAVRAVEGWRGQPVKLTLDAAVATAAPLPQIDACTDVTDMRGVTAVLRSLTGPTRVLVLPVVLLEGAPPGHDWMDPGWVPKLGGSSEHCLLVVPADHFLQRFYLGAALFQHLYGLFSLFQSHWLVCQWLQLVAPAVHVSVVKRVALAPGAHAVQARLRGADVEMQAC